MADQCRLLHTHDVSDLCIGKPALRWLPPSSTVADAVAELHHQDAKGCRDAALAVWDGSGGLVGGRVCMADVLLFLCADDHNLASPAAALQATLADLLASTTGAKTVRLVQPDASVLEAADAFLDGVHSLVVPIRTERCRAPAESSAAPGAELCCWLTLEDLVRFFLTSSIALFAPTASRSVSELGIVRPASLAVAAGDDALSAVVPLLRTALASHASVAVVVSSSEYCPRRLVGDISTAALGSGCSNANVSVVAAAIAALSAGDLLAFIDWGGDATLLHAVRSRLRRRGLHGMLDQLLLLHGGDSCPSSSSSCSSSSSASSCSSSSSSSSDEDEDYGKKSSTSSFPCARRGKQHQRLASYSTSSMGRRRAEEAIVCRRGSSLVAVMVQALAHRATQVWVVEGEERELVGVVGLLDVLRVLTHHLHQPPPL